MTYSGLGNVESALGKIGKELFGLERQARSTLDNIHIYLNLPGLIKQPLILNYWGPTGTGKTRLVKEIVNHLGLNNRFISFNLTNSSTSYWDSKISDIEELINENNESSKDPVVLLFDEIQHARTLNNEGHEIQQQQRGELWGILDYGVQYLTGEAVPTIIFIAGNIDLYTNEKIDNWEGSPDSEEQEINIPIQFIYQALSKRFRPEMVARLRTNHFLFPPLDQKRSTQIIARELEHTAQIIKEKYEKINFQYNDSFVEYLLSRYKSKGMGARGIESHVNEIVKSRIGHWLLIAKEKGYSMHDIREIKVSGFEDDLHVEVLLSDGKRFEQKNCLRISRLAGMAQDPDEIAVYAVHEAGHALAGYLSGSGIPDLISVGSGIGTIKAFVRLTKTHYILSKRRLEYMVGQALAGLLAENLIFGTRNATHGSADDMYKVFHMVSKSLLESGLGSNLLARSCDFPIVFGEGIPALSNNDLRELEDFVRDIANRTKNNLDMQRKALLELSQQIYYRGELNQSEFLEIMDATIDKELLARYHDIDLSAEDVKNMKVSEIIDLLNFNYVDALFGINSEIARKNVLVGSEQIKAAYQKESDVSKIKATISTTDMSTDDIRLSNDQGVTSEKTAKKSAAA